MSQLAVMQEHASHKPGAEPSERVHHNLKKFTMPGITSSGGRRAQLDEDEMLADGEIPSFNPHR